ncbi:hypothetical protein CLCR_02345 [Cladophialophora carrionii]|uniref:Uncharacterized protein n=1 Tax=Cladophialophora carrionii TaxID=86049 RepID=A0A1C1CEN9_9EURO|nr:hypothetical protein CLCR_02345 [Cladophialophora carrionii]
MVPFHMYRHDDEAPNGSSNSGKPSPLEANATFINITHPAQRQDAATRKKVAQYIGVNFRNRSKPMARREANGSGPKAGNSQPPSQRQLRARGAPIQDWVDRDQHGLRSDPFASYPIRSQDWLPEAVDFFLNAYGPTHLLRRTATGGPRRYQRRPESTTETSPVHQYFQYSLEHPVMFEAMIALSLSNLRIHHWEQGQVDKETAYHYGNVLSSLQRTLGEADGYRETAVLWTILALLELEYLVGSMTAFEAHINGLHRLVDLQGGLAYFDKCKLLGPAIRGLSVTNDDLTTAAYNEASRDRPIVAPEVLEGLNAEDSTAGPVRFGEGILRLVQERRLSAPVFFHARDIYDNWQDVDLCQNSPYSVQNALNMELRERGWNLLGNWLLPNHGGLTLADYILLIGLQHTLLDTTHAERYSPFYRPAVMRWVSCCSTFLDRVNQQSDAATADLLSWVCIKLAGSLTATFLRARSDSEDDPRFRLVIKMMSRYPETGEWSSLKKVIQRFQWREDCLAFWYKVWKMVVESDIVARNVYIA